MIKDQIYSIMFQVQQRAWKVEEILAQPAGTAHRDTNLYDARYHLDYAVDCLKWLLPEAGRPTYIHLPEWDPKAGRTKYRWQKVKDKEALDCIRMHAFYLARSYQVDVTFGDNCHYKKLLGDKWGTYGRPTKGHPRDQLKPTGPTRDWHWIHYLQAETADRREGTPPKASTAATPGSTLPPPAAPASTSPSDYDQQPPKAPPAAAVGATALAGTAAHKVTPSPKPVPPPPPQRATAAAADPAVHEALVDFFLWQHGFSIAKKPQYM